MGGQAETMELDQACEMVGYLAVSGEADRSVVLGRKYLALAARSGHLVAAVRLRHSVGLALAQLRQWEPALAELERAADEALRAGRPDLQALVWASTAWTEARAGRPEVALREFSRAHAVLERERPSQGTVTASVNLAMSALQLGLLEISRRWFDYAHDNAAQLPGLMRQVAVWANETLLDYEQALVHEHGGRPGPARAWYERSAENGRRVRDLVAGELPEVAAPWLLSAAVNQGCCLAKLGRPEEALRELDSVSAGVDTQTVLITRAAANMGRAWASVAVGDVAGCRRYGEAAVRLADSIGWGRWQADTHLALARAAELSDDPAGRSAHAARAADLLAQLGWQARLRRLGVTLAAAADRDDPELPAEAAGIAAGDHVPDGQPPGPRRPDAGPVTKPAPAGGSGEADQGRGRSGSGRSRS